jgi:hypothetical protein
MESLDGAFLFPLAVNEIILATPLVKYAGTFANSFH